MDNHTYQQEAQRLYAELLFFMVYILYIYIFSYYIFKKSSTSMDFT